MKKLIIFIFLVFNFCFLIKAQPNLVPNPSFEDTVSCPTTMGQINKTIPWSNASNGSPDYFNKCSNVPNYYVGVPINDLGYQNARTGNAYAGLETYFPNQREYIEVQLDSTLKAGKKYCVLFYVSLANASKNAIDTLGAYLSTASIFVSTQGPLPYIPQIKNKNGVISDTVNWVEVSGEYIASGGEQYITIGIFNDDATMNKIPAGGTKYDDAYYYIDDVTVIACNGLGVGELMNDIFKIKLYPNPNDGNIFLEYELKNNKKGNFIIYDVTGRKVSNYILQEGKNTMQVNEEILQNGIYYYSVTVESDIVKSDKLIIIK
ncbi:MAG: T9SS type A sorting domain-containing protein [Bacteroidota bacterium]